MKSKIAMLALAAASTLTLMAAPAMAQPGGEELHMREDRMTQWVHDSARSGRITRREANGFFYKLRDIRAEEHAFRSRQGGRLSPNQFASIDGRLHNLAGWVHYDQGGAH